MSVEQSQSMRLLAAPAGTTGTRWQRLRATGPPSAKLVYSQKVYFFASVVQRQNISFPS